MNTVEKLTAALGIPRDLRVIASGRHLVAAVGRWRHQGAQVDLGGTGTAQLVFNVSGGQRVALRGGAVSCTASCARVPSASSPPTARLAWPSPAARTPCRSSSAGR